MEIPQIIAKERQAIDRALADFLKKEAVYASDFGKVPREMVEQIDRFSSRAGKRIRPIFVKYGYLACGGRPGAGVLQASLAVEMLHAWFLAHDDVIDRDDLRRGGPTMHKMYEKLAGKYMVKSPEKEHFGVSMAICAGDVMAGFCNKILGQSGFPAERVVKAMNKLQDIILVTGYGQLLDITLAGKKTATEKEVLAVHRAKTAKYTIEGPLHLGAILAGAGEKFLAILSAYAKPLGMAFQIQDDILGVFGDEEKVGKPIGSDVAEGKKTLLTVKAFASANKAQKKILRVALGNEKVTKKQLRDFRKVVYDTGAYDYSVKKARRMVEEAIEIMKETDLSVSGKEFLIGMAEYIKNREF